MNLYKHESRIDSKHYKGTTHPGKNPRRPRSCANRVRVGGGLSRTCSYPSQRLKSSPTAVGACISRSGGAGTRRVSNRCDTTMNATQRPTNGPTFNPRCPACPGGVPAGPPQKWDTLFRQYKRSYTEIHNQFSNVSCLSWVITKTIAYVGAGAPMRPVNGFANQAGQAGHRATLKRKSGLEALSRRNRVSHFEKIQAGHPGTAGTLDSFDRRVQP